MKKKKTNKKYGLKNIGRAFSNAAKNLAEAQRKKKEYLQSPEYAKKLAINRKRELEALNYQIAKAKKLKQLQKVNNSRGLSKIEKPLGINLGSELGLN